MRRPRLFFCFLPESSFPLSPRRISAAPGLFRYTLLRPVFSSPFTALLRYSFPSFSSASSLLSSAPIFLSPPPPQQSGIRRSSSKASKNKKRGRLLPHSKKQKKKAPIGTPPLWSERQDLNLRPLGPEPSALPSCATPRYKYKYRKDHSSHLRELL